MSTLSPITKTNNIRLIEKIAASKIIELYKTELGVDVINSFNGIESVYIYECLDTGYFFYNPENLSGDENFYDTLKIQMPKKFNVPYYSDWKWEYDVSINFIKSSDHVYEIGCGNGNFLKKLIDCGVKNVSGTELNKNSISHAKEKGLNIEYKTIQVKAKETFEEFDIVCAFQVLEHIDNVKSFIDSSLQILKKGGKLIIAVPFNNPYLFRNDILNTLNMPPHHMGLWNKKAFMNMDKFFPMCLEKLIIEKLPAEGYDFNRFYFVNKDIIYSKGMPFKYLFDKLYLKWLKTFHRFYGGKNIIAVFIKNE